MTIKTESCSIENLSESHGNKCKSYEFYKSIIKWFYVDFSKFTQFELENYITMKKAGMVLHCSKGIINLYIKNNLLTSMKIPTTNPLHRYQGTKQYNKIETKSLAKLINLMREHISHTLIPFEQSSYINNVFNPKNCVSINSNDIDTMFNGGKK